MAETKNFKHFDAAPSLALARKMMLLKLRYNGFKDFYFLCPYCFFCVFNRQNVKTTVRNYLTVYKGITFA
jgi:hypothetical protein